MVPLPHLVERPPFGREDFVERAAILSRFQMRVLRVAIVQYLHLVARVSQIVRLKRHPDAHAVIGPRRQFEIHAQDVIRELAVRHQVIARVGRRGDDAIGDEIGRPGPLVHFRPPRQRLAVEERNKPLLLLPHQAAGKSQGQNSRERHPRKSIHKRHNMHDSTTRPRPPRQCGFLTQILADGGRESFRGAHAPRVSQSAPSPAAFFRPLQPIRLRPLALPAYLPSVSFFPFLPYQAARAEAQSSLRSSISLEIRSR